MEEKIITFTANEQGLVKTGGISHYASDTISYIKAVFTLGENWNGFDEVRAVFKSPYECRPAVLDSNGECYVPVEVLFYKGKVRVNLVGSIVTETEVTDRLTTYSVEALDVDEDVPICGEESQPISPSEYEQFVAKVANDANRASQSATASANSADEAEASAQNASESASASAVSASDSARSATASAQSAQNASESAQNAENAKDDAEDARDKILSMRATAETLEAGSDATASYSDGLLTLGIPRGDRGEQGIQGETGATPNLTIGTVETLAPTEDATASITGTAENPVLNLGLPKGDTGEVSLEDLGALLPTDTASGDIVTIPDGQSVIPAESLKVALEPIQSGSGTPSPDNVRPIYGRTEVVTQRTGKNLLNSIDPTMLNAYYNVATISTENVNNRIVVVPCAPSTDYFFTWNRAAISGTQNARICTFESMPTYGATGTLKVANVSEGASASFTTGERDTYIAIYCGDVRATDVLESVNASMLGYGSTATAYEPYQVDTYTTALGQTVYGGTLDVVTGELVVDRGYIASYNGETLPSTWISDRDEYASGTTPTIGAEVVYELATPQTYQLTPQEISLLHGNNNVWSDGEVELTYNADVGLYIDKKLGTSGTRTLSMTKTLETKSEETKTDDTKSDVELTKSDNIQLAED